MTEFILDTLQNAGYRTILAHYEPYSTSPELSTPAYALGRRRPSSEVRVSETGVETHAIGAWLPELEFTHFFPGGEWDSLMDRCGRYVSVSGNVLAATPFAKRGKKFLSWVAAGWQEDRTDRVEHFPLYRKVLDRWINSPVLRRMEQEVLSTGHVLALSQQTKGVLNRLGGSDLVRGVLPMPIDGEQFRPNPGSVVPFRIGFSGRFGDPRKNIDLLIDVFIHIVRNAKQAELILIGDEPNESLLKSLAERGVAHQVTFPGYLGRQDLRDWLSSLDVFMIPSHQEGLCIAALEAMSCGVPVVSTRCGGPDEFVIEGETGYLAGYDASELAALICAISGDRERRRRMGESARQLVLDRYSPEVCTSIFWQAWAECYDQQERISA